jgi:hypothetical protein
MLLPKRTDAASISDLRPISLNYLVAKLFAKLLSLWLAPRLDSVFSKNQNAFIARWSLTRQLRASAAIREGPLSAA